MLSSTSMRALAKNASWMLAGQVCSVTAQAGYFILLARLLGATQFGLYVAVVSFVSIGSQFGTLGSGYVLLRYGSMDKALYPKYWGNVLLATLVFGGLVVCVLTLSSSFVLPHTSIWLVLVVATSDTILGGLVQCAGQVFQTFELMSRTAMLSLATNILRLIAACTFTLTLAHISPLIWALAVLSVSAIVALAGVALTTQAFGRPQFSLALLRRHAGEGAIFAVSSSTTSIYNDLDKILLGHEGMNQANGIYSLAYRAINIANIPVFAAHAAAFPRFFQQGAHGIAATLPLARKLQLRTLAVTGAMAIALFACAPLIPVLTNRSYAESVMALRWLCVIPMFRSFQWSAGDSLAGAGLQKYRLVLQLGAAVFNLVLNIWLIPRYSWRGAAWSSLATDGSLALAMWCVYLYLTSTQPRLTGPSHSVVPLP
jgi:O-antigen/teichoic acid export membrane protein